MAQAAMAQSSDESSSMEIPTLPDLSALRQLDEMVRNGSVVATRASFAREKYQELHRTLSQSVANARKALEESMELSKQLKKEQEILEKVIADAAEDGTALEILQEDSEQADSEALACKEREIALLAEEADLKKVQEDYQIRIDDIQKEHAVALAPQLIQLRIDIQDLTGQNEGSRTKLEEMRKERNEVEGKLKQVIEDMHQMQSEKKIATRNMLALEGVPEKLKKQGDAIFNTVKNLQAQEQHYIDKIREYEGEITKLRSSATEITDAQGRSAIDLERIRHATSQKEQAASEMTKDYELNNIESDQYLADKVTLDMQLKSMNGDLKLEQEHLATYIGDRDKLLRKLKNAETVLRQAQESIPSFILQKENIHHQLLLAESEQKKVSSCVSELRKDIDIRMHHYLGLENLGKEVVTTLHVGYKKVTELEKELSEVIEFECAQQKHIGDLSSMRDHFCRILSSKIQHLKEAKERIRSADITIGFLRRKATDAQKLSTDFREVYNLIRSQRNKFKKTVQLSGLAIDELRDKTRLLDVELGMLQNEVLSKDQILAKMGKELKEIVQKHSFVRSEIVQSSAILKEKKESADAQLIEVEKLTDILRRIEQEMGSFRKQYELLVTTRNQTGICLIDRNDELSILYEKLHAEDELLNHSDIELLKRENEISLLKTVARNLQRSIPLLYKCASRTTGVKKAIKDIKKQLVAVTRQGDNLSRLLESPENKTRWKLLEGRDLTEAELIAKKSALEHFVNEKSDQSLEKDLIVEEITALSDDLTKRAAKEWINTLKIGMKANRYQRRMRSITRQMMATVSELSLCQATAMSLKQEEVELSELLKQAHLRLASGQAPTEDAEREWLRMERTAMLDEAEAGDNMQNEIDVDKRNTTAVQRPTAYISEEFGLPKPFGVHAQFRALDSSNANRYIRKPEPKNIELPEE